MAGALGGQDGLPILTAYRAKETGAIAECWTTTQDERGMLYFGSDTLLSFDGDRWRQYAMAGCHTIRGLAVGANGRLWAAAINEIGYFDRTATGNLSAYRSLVAALPPGTPELGDVWSVFAEGDGAVFVTGDAVLVWTGTAFQIHRLPGARRLQAMRVDGKIYVSHLTKGLWTLEREGLRRLLAPEQLNEAGCTLVETTTEGWVLTTSKGLARFAAGQTTPFGAEASDFIRKSILTAACRLPNGDLCVGTVNSGLGLIAPDGRLKRVITPHEGLLSLTVLSLYVARDGAVWVTSPTGLVRIELDGAAALYDGRNGLAGKPCNSLAQAAGYLLVATDDGVFRYAMGEAAPGKFAPAPALNFRCHDILGAANDVYATAFKGLERVRDGRRQRVFATEADVLLLERSRLRPESFFIANNFELMRLDPRDDQTLAGTSLAHLPDYAQSVAEDAMGTIWIGTQSRGILFLPDALPARPQPLKSPVERAAEGSGVVGFVSGAIALCSQEGIQLRLSPTEAPVLVAGAPKTNPRSISNPDPAGRVWLAFDSPFTENPRTPIIGRLSLDRDKRGIWEPFVIPGLAQIDRVTRLYADDQGGLWVGGADGLLRLDPARLAPTPVPRPPLVSANIANASKLRYSDHTVTFDFGSVEFRHRAAVRFQTKLSGSTDAWSEPTHNSHLAVAGLRDGDYTFAVRVINDAGQSSPEAVWHFTVLPPWYRTKLAYTGWSLLALAGFFGGIYWRSAYLHRQNARLEALVQKKTEQLEKANAAKSEFLANMSHEIRNPISGIVGLSLAMEETVLDQRQKTLTDSIRSCATLLATLVDDVLDFSKIEAGKIELRLAPFALRATLAQCADMVKEDLRVTGSRVALEIAPEVPELLIGDSARIQQIILNYLTNAVKFGAGRTVTLGATAIPPGRVRLFVRDQGAGMSEADAASLFTKFTRLERARTDNIRGSGLGLAVCRLLATKMGGSVGVESRLGAGSCFWAELPLPPTGAAPRLAVVPAPGATPLRALIVEDIDYNATAMQAVLRKLGIVSEVASDGPTALERLQQSFYDVAFMDWNLPGMIGTEVVARYRALEPANRRTIIIATTAYSADFNREACLQAGMDAFIAKPFTPEKISLALQDLRGSLRAAASVEVRSLREFAPPVSGIDLELLQLLAEESPEGLSGQIDRYLAAIEADRQALGNSIAAGDIKEIHRLAHRLASHASMVKFEPLGCLAAEMQTHAATRDPDRLPRLFAEFNRELGGLRDRLDALRTSAPPA